MTNVRGIVGVFNRTPAVTTVATKSLDSIEAPSMRLPIVTLTSSEPQSRVPAIVATVGRLAVSALGVVGIVKNNAVAPTKELPSTIETVITVTPDRR